VNIKQHLKDALTATDDFIQYASKFEDIELFVCMWVVIIVLGLVILNEL
jgi:hypothetical protein